MKKSQEKVLVAALCGVVIAAGAIFAMSPAMAASAGASKQDRIEIIITAPWDTLKLTPTAQS